MSFHYFHIPTKIIQHHESFNHLYELPELIKKRVIIVTDSYLVKLGVTQNLFRFIENICYGLISFDIDEDCTLGVSEEDITMVKDSKAQTIVGFGNSNVLTYARTMADLATDSEGEKISYIEIPSLPSIYTGLLETYYIADTNQTFKKSHRNSSCAKWLFLDSMYIDSYPQIDIFSSSVQSLAYTVDALLSRNSNALTESYGFKAIELIFSAIHKLIDKQTTIQVKDELMIGSLLATLAIQTSDLGVSGGLSMAMQNASICSESKAAGAVLMKTLEYSLPTNIDLFQKIYRVLNIGDSKDPSEMSEEVLKAFQHLLDETGVKPLSNFCLTEATINLIAKQATSYKFMLDLVNPAGFYELTNILNTSLTNEKNPDQDILHPIDKSEIESQLESSTISS